MNKDLTKEEVIQGIKQRILDEYRKYKSLPDENAWAEIAASKIYSNSVPLDLKNVTCPQCKEKFILIWNDYSDTPETLKLRGCPSGGIYDVSIKCPHCDYEEPL